MKVPEPARYIMIGGFLGAGKSTAISRLARRLTDRGLRIGLITNDQGPDLVDSATLRAQGFPVEEIAGGCFCCRFNSLVDAARSLSADATPDVFVAEPVGSCTDLVATVSYPLRRIYGEEFRIAPLSVLVDPVRAERVLGIDDGRSFSKKVVYVYEKQLEEAEIIVINKCDLLDDERRGRLRVALAARFPKADVLEVSARTGDGLDAWFERLERDEMGTREVMEIDYDVYAQGEALLGWLNATLELRACGEEGVDGNQLLRRLADAIHARLESAGGEVAHLKMTLSPDGDPLGAVGVVNLVRQDYVPEVCQHLEDRVVSGQVILNLRAESSPDVLEEIVTSEAAKEPLLKLDHFECFRPGRPEPTHRDGLATGLNTGDAS